MEEEGGESWRLRKEESTIAKSSWFHGEWMYAVLPKAKPKAKPKRRDDDSDDSFDSNDWEGSDASEPRPETAPWGATSHLQKGKNTFGKPTFCDIEKYVSQTLVKPVVS